MSKPKPSKSDKEPGEKKSDQEPGEKKSDQEPGERKSDQEPEEPAEQPQVIYVEEEPQQQVVYVAQQPRAVVVDVPPDAELLVDEKGRLLLRHCSRQERAIFVRKVFGLVMLMLAVVTLMSAIPFLSPEVRDFVQDYSWIYYISYAVFLVVYILLICVESVRRSFPSNLFTVALLTISLGYMTMMICAFHDIISVLIALITTTICCTSVIIFSMQTKWDITSWISVLWIVAFGLLIFGIVAVVAIIAFQVYFLYVIYAGLAALLFMVYLAIDVQMVVGGKKYQISKDECVFGAVQIFVDIVMIFMMLLTITGCARGS